MGMFTIGVGLGGTLMELAGGQSNYRQLAEEIGEVLQAAAETAEKMQEDAHGEAARIRAEAEAELRAAYAEGRRVLDEARMEADMLRAEAEWQGQEIIAQARRHAAERQAGADSRLADLERVENRVLDRLAGVGQVLADSLATLREGPAIGDIAATPATMSADAADPANANADDAGADDDGDHPTGKVYFVEFPPYATPAGASAYADPEADREIVLTESPGASLFADDQERSEWAPPSDLPTWWTRGGAQG
jgi:hypothetical protein